MKECDKSFTRTDALQKHMRTQHGEVIAPTRKPPTKKRAPRAGSADSVADVPFKDDDASTTLGDEDEDLEPLWTEEELELFDRHPTLGHNFAGFVVLKAKRAYLMSQHEGAAAELEALGVREAELGAECDELLRRVMRKEVGFVVPLPTLSSSISLKA